MEGEPERVTVLLAEIRSCMERLADRGLVLQPMLEALRHTDATA